MAIIYCIWNVNENNGGDRDLFCGDFEFMKPQLFLWRSSVTH